MLLIRKRKNRKHKNSEPITTTFIYENAGVYGLPLKRNY